MYSMISPVTREKYENMCLGGLSTDVFRQQFLTDHEATISRVFYDKKYKKYDRYSMSWPYGFIDLGRASRSREWVDFQACFFIYLYEYKNIKNICDCTYIVRSFVASEEETEKYYASWKYFIRENFKKVRFFYSSLYYRFSRWRNKSLTQDQIIVWPKVKSGK